ncbi:hypothetical protein ABEX29_01215 [Brevibacillus porteri]
MTAIQFLVVKLLAILFVVAGVGFILFSENGLSAATITFFQNLLNHTL